MSDLEARIAEVLTEHDPHFPFDDGATHCDCGQWRDDSCMQDINHRLHVAAMLAPVIAEAKVEALREAADKFQRGDWFNVIEGNAHVKVGNGQRVTEWLKARADNLEKA